MNQSVKGGAGRTSVTLKMAANSVSQVSSPQHHDLPKPQPRETLTPVHARESLTNLQSSSMNRASVKAQPVTPAAATNTKTKSDDNKIGINHSIYYQR